MPDHHAAPAPAPSPSPVPRLALGFAAAMDKRPGDKVAHCGNVETIVQVLQAGKDWPYFRFKGDETGRWVSWQLCGDA